MRRRFCYGILFGSSYPTTTHLIFCIIKLFYLKKIAPPSSLVFVEGCLFVGTWPKSRAEGKEISLLRVFVIANVFTQIVKFRG